MTADDLDGAAWDIDEWSYHQDPWGPVGERSLSSTVAKHLLPPSTPEHAAHAIAHRVQKRAFDLGSAAHALILGRGADIVEVPADDWRTNAAKALRDEAHEQGRTPMLTRELDAARAMADRVLSHDTAAALLARPGQPEVALTWREGGVPCRAMLDFWPDPDAPDPVAVDVKTTESTDDAALARVVANLRYHVQEAFYRRGYWRVHGIWPAFVFVAVEKTPPHAVRVVELDDATRDAGDAAVDRAVEIWRDCTATGLWPGRPAGIGLIGLPKWARRTTFDDVPGGLDS